MNSAKLFFIIVFIYAFSSIGYSQNPVNWSFNTKKIADKIYDIHLTVSVSSPWHIYSQTTPDGGPSPTKIRFSKNPLVTLEGKINEVGKMFTKHEEVFGVDVHYYDGKVDFVQTIRLKNNVKTKLNGTIEYMACNDEQCLPPTTVPFSVELK